MNKQALPRISRLKRFLALSKEIVRPVLGPIYHFVRRFLRFLTWTFSAMGNLLLPVSAEKRRLLIIFDTSSQPFNIGDILIMQAVSLALREKHGVGKVDFALIYDPYDPAAFDPAFNSINDRNVIYHLASILPVAQVNQHLGSLLLFDSDLHLQRYVADSADLYQVWPSGWKFASQDYLYYEAFNQVFYEYYKKHGSIMRLTCRPFLVDWARTFYHDHVCQQVPVTVNIRNNMLFQTYRNATLDAWLEFFKYCESRYPVKFIVICAWSEIDERLRNCSNVMIAKDYHTGIEQDLALIHTSAIHMGVGSGPMSMAWFNTSPYLMVNTVYGPNYFKHPDMVVEIEPGIQRFCFAGPLQRIVAGVETTELLIDEFARMWVAVDLQRWQSTVNLVKESETELHTWLR
jgi:hypothetical protein